MKKKQKAKSGFQFPKYGIYIIILVIFLGLQIYTSFAGGSEKTNQNQFFDTFLKNNDVEKIVIINKETAEVFIKKDALSKSIHKNVSSVPIGKSTNPGPHYYFSIGDLQNFEKTVNDYRERQNLDVITEFESRKDIFGTIISWLFPIMILVFVWTFVMRRFSGGSGGGGTPTQIFGIGKSKAKLFDRENDVKTTFKDVAGLVAAKYEVEEIVHFLKEPKKYTSLGGKIPKGALLVGSPGTGKTLLAKAVAGEAQVPFFSLSGSDFVEMFVGVGASRVRDLFQKAKAKSPCIIFIDEIDAIGRARGKSNMTGGNDERENTLNQLLTEMDGFGTDTGVIVLAATNRADVLDKALLRAGRFDRQIHVDLPDLKEREEIFLVYAKNLKTDDSVQVDLMAKQTPGFSGADIANVCNESALIAARKNKSHVSKQDFLDAVDRIVGGLEKRSKIISPKEKKLIAYHEAGHATVSWLLEHAAPLVKVTVVPRGRSLGAAWYLPEERQITQTDQILDEMCAALGGRASEQTIFGKISTGALSDLEQVTRQANAMVTIYGLNSKIGNITYYDSTGQQEMSFAKPYSEETAKTIDTEISSIVEKQYQRALSILSDHKDKLTAVANMLLKKEVLFPEDMEKIMGKRSFGNDTTDPKSLTEETNVPVSESSTL